MRFAPLVLIVCLLAACGQSGALYLPEDQPAAEPATQTAPAPPDSEADPKKIEGTD